MTAVRTVFLVIQRELRARRKAAVIVTGVLAVTALVGLVILQTVGSGKPNPIRLASDEADQVVGFLGVVILFMAIVMTGQVILLGVAEEKNSRVAEVILGAMRPRHLLVGKVVAIGLIGLFEVVFTGSLVLVVGSALDRFELPAATAGAVGIVIVWFVLGFAFYAVVYAAAGSLVARHQNAANAAGPINLVLMVGYFIGGASAYGGADGLVLRIASLLPPLAPVTMPLRMVHGSAQHWEIGIAVTLVVTSSYGLILAAERVYSGGMLRSGKVRLREAWRSAAR